MKGKFCTIELLDAAKHGQDLFDTFTADQEDLLWTYMAMGPFDTFAEFSSWLTQSQNSVDPLFHVIINRKDGRAVGLAALMRIKPEIGVIEIGNIVYSPLLQKTALATEAMYLFMARVFDELGYRRYEWKCDSLNAGSIRAAERLGFVYEGLFRQALIYKGRNRDTSWYSILDKDWPVLKRVFLKWLNADNFDTNGDQKTRLQDIDAG